MMTSVYEDNYVAVYEARKATKDLDTIVNILKNATAPMSCEEIGTAAFGRQYLGNRSLSAHMGQILRHLRKGGHVAVSTRKGSPIEIECEEYMRNVDDEGNPPTIIVHDDEGNKYQINNPKYHGHCWGGRWVKVKKTIEPVTKLYTFVCAQ